MATVIQGASIVDRVNREARDVHIGRLVLTVFAVVLVAVGWTIGKTISAVIAAAGWSVAAVRVGYRDGRGIN